MNVRARVLATIAVATVLLPNLLLNAQGTAPAPFQTIALRASAPGFENFSTSSAPAPAPAPTTAQPSTHGMPKVDLFLGYSRFGVGVNSNTGTAGNRIVGLNGGSAALAFHFNRFFALAADFGGYDDSQLQLTGTGANQPRTVNSSGTAFTYMFGPRLTFAREHRVSVFAQVLAGGIHASQVTVTNCAGSACTPLPAQNSLAMTAGGGLDIRLTHLLSLRVVQAEYMLTRFAAVPSGSSSSQNDLRLSSGLVFRFGAKDERAPLQLQCSVQPQSGFPGDTFSATAVASNLNPKHPAVYSWTTTGGVVSGTDTSSTISTAGLAPGVYTASAKVTQGNRPGEQADCSASFTVQAFAPPTISCAAAPSQVLTGDPVTVTALATSPQNRALTYSYTTTSGKIAGTTATALLTTAGADPGTINVTCNVTDDLGKSASSGASVMVTAPAPIAAPQTRDLCAISFERDRRRPVRVDNEAKACLDDIALQMQHDAGGRLIIIGNASPEESPAQAAERSRSERQYLTVEKGIDAQRIELRSGTAGSRTAANVFVPVGATYTSTETIRLEDPAAR